MMWTVDWAISTVGWTVIVLSGMVFLGGPCRRAWRQYRYNLPDATLQIRPPIRKFEGFSQDQWDQGRIRQLRRELDVLETRKRVTAQLRQGELRRVIGM